MMRYLALLAAVLMLLSAIPLDVTAEWVAPVPGSKTDDEFWDVTYDFESFWAKNWPNYTVERSSREESIAVYNGKLFILWEGTLVPNTPQQPVAYLGKVYMRSYCDTNGTPAWGPIIDVTPNAVYSDHNNMKSRLIPYKDKLYIFWESGDNAQKPAGTPVERFDIMLRVYDEAGGTPHLSQPAVLGRSGSSGAWGFDQWPALVVYKDKLYVIWYREDIIKGFSDLLYMAYDGTGWSDVKVMSRYPNNDTTNIMPSATVWKDRLYVLWQTWVSSKRSSQVVYSCTEDGNIWTPIVNLSKTIDLTRSGKFDMMPGAAVYDNPVTGKVELHAFWKTLGGFESTQGSEKDTDLVTRVFDGTSWGPTRELSPTYDDGVDTDPNIIAFGGQLHIFWATRDKTDTLGNDGDILHVVYDGQTYSQPVEISRHGDRDEFFLEDGEVWNKGDDFWPRAVIYPDRWGGPRLFVAWWTNDYITGCCYDEPNGTESSIVLTLLVDADHDGDGVKDHYDACPDDPMDHVDSDGDGVCDSKDWKPNDPTVWNEPSGGTGNGPRGDPMLVYVLLIVLFMVGVALLAYRGGKKAEEKGTAEDAGVAASEDE